MTCSILSPRALQEAQEIFGVDFDYDEFEKYNEYDEDLEEEYEYEPEEAEGEIRVRPKKTTKKRVSRRSIFEMYEPSELESSHLTDQDNEIRVTDMPERFQVSMAFSRSPQQHRLQSTVLQEASLSSSLSFPSCAPFL